MNQGSNSFRGQRRSSSSGDGSQTAPVKDHLQKTFMVRYQSEMDGKVYEGQFTTKKLSIRDMGHIGTRRSQLNGGFYFDEDNPGVGIDEITHSTNNMIAHFEVALIQKASWFDLDEIYDVGLLGAVFKHIADFENSFFRSTRPKAEGDASGVGSAGRNGEGEGAGSAGSVTAVGGGEVPDSLDA